MKKVERNQRKNRPKKKWIKIIKEDMRTCEVDEDMIWNREDRSKKIQIAYPTCMR